MGARRALTAALLGTVAVALAGPPAAAAETVLAYTIRDARAFAAQFAYPQGTVFTGRYLPCDPAEDPYGCDRARYNDTPGSCPQDVALGSVREALETPTPEDAAGGVTEADAAAAKDPVAPVGSPVTLNFGLAQGRIGSTPEAGGLASMFYVDNFGRFEADAHAESDAYTDNRRTYEERCEAVDAFGGGQDFPFDAHVLSRSGRTPETYSLSSFTTAPGPTPPGAPKEAVSIVKLWQANGRINGLLTSTVRGLSVGALTVDLVRTVVWFSSDGTPKGLEIAARSEALGLTVGPSKLASLSQGLAIPLDDEGSVIGVLAPVVRIEDAGATVSVRAAGLVVAGKTPLDQIPIPEDPFAQEPFPEDLAGRVTLGGRLYSEQVLSVAGAFIEAGLGRTEEFDFPTPALAPPFVPPAPPPGIAAPSPPAPGGFELPAPSRPVALPQLNSFQMRGSTWPLLANLLAGALGLLAILGRWSLRFSWARALSQRPPLRTLGRAQRIFLKG